MTRFRTTLCLAPLAALSCILSLTTLSACGGDDPARGRVRKSAVAVLFDPEIPESCQSSVFDSLLAAARASEPYEVSLSFSGPRDPDADPKLPRVIVAGLDGNVIASWDTDVRDTFLLRDDVAYRANMEFGLGYGGPLRVRAIDLLAGGGQVWVAEVEVAEPGPTRIVTRSPRAKLTFGSGGELHLTVCSVGGTPRSYLIDSQSGRLRSADHSQSE